MSVGPHPEAATSRARREPFAPRTLGALIVLLALSTSPGCIRRYAAPEEPADATTPYSAFAALHRVTPPTGPEGTPLPVEAFRLAVSPEGWLADTMLVLGEAGSIGEGSGDVGAALSVLGEGAEPIVLLVDASRLGEPALCELATMLGERARLATGLVAYGRDAAPARPQGGTSEDARGGTSRDPLGGVSGDRVCGASAVR